MSNYVLTLLQLCISFIFLLYISKIVIAPTAIRYDRVNIIDYVHKNCQNAGIECERENVSRMITATLIVTALVGFVITPIGIIIFPAGALIGFLVFIRGRTRWMRLNHLKVNDEICFFVARLLRSGQTLESALRKAEIQYPQSKILCHIVHHMQGGSSLSRSVGQQEITKLQLNNSESMLCATIALAYSMGGNSARIFERIGDSFHQEYDLSHDTVVSLSQVKMSTLVVSLLPCAMFGFSLFSGGETVSFLFTHPLGVTCIVIGALLQLLGIIWMKKQVHKGIGIWVS